MVGNVFPTTFEATIKKINRLLLHVFAHVYQCHTRDIVLLKLHGHLNTVYYHFHMFNRQFSLVEDKEMEVLDDLYARLHYHATHKVQFDASEETIAMSQHTSDGGSACVDESHKTKTADSTKEIADENKENVVGRGSTTSYPSLTLVT